MTSWYQNQLDLQASKADPRGKLFYNSLSEYAIDFPEAKELDLEYYTKLDSMVLIKLDSKWGACGLTGDYIYLFIGKFLNGDDFLIACDCDDGIRRLIGARAHLEATLEAIKILAPLNFQDLEDIFGFQPE